MTASLNTVPIVFDTLRSVAFGSITGTFATVGSALSFPARIIKFINTTNGDMEVSIDGTNVHDRVPANGFSLYDISAAHPAPGQSGMQEKISIYVREISGGPALTGGYFCVTVLRGNK